MIILCGVTKRDGESNENIYERYLVEWVKKNLLRLFGHIESMKSEEIEESRERPLGRWEDKVKEYMCERGATRRRGFEPARGKHLDRERWRLCCCGHPFGGQSKRE